MNLRHRINSFSRNGEKINNQHKHKIYAQCKSGELSKVHCTKETNARVFTWTKTNRQKKIPSRSLQFATEYQTVYLSL